MEKTKFLITIFNCVLLLNCNKKPENPIDFNEVSKIDNLNTLNLDSLSEKTSKTTDVEKRTENFNENNILFLDFYYGMNKNEVGDVIIQKITKKSLTRDNENSNQIYYNFNLNNSNHVSKLFFDYDKNQTLKNVSIDIPVVSSEYFPSNIKFVNDNKLFANYVKTYEKRLNDIIALFSLKYQSPTKKIKSEEEKVYPGDIFIMKDRFGDNFIKPKSLDYFYEFNKGNLNIKIISSIYVIKVKYSLNSDNEQIKKQNKIIEKQNLEKTLNEI